VVYNLLRTRDAVAPIGAPAVATSLVAFVLVYFVVFGIGVLYILKLMGKPPHPGESLPDGAPIRSAGITPASSVARVASHDNVSGEGRDEH
jgi:cytochrome d ubiquinol oxidase subunit I